MVNSNFYNSTIFCLLYLQVRNNQNVSKNAINVKELHVKSHDEMFEKISEKCTNFEITV